MGDDIDLDSDDISDTDEEYDDDEHPLLNKNIFQRLKQNDPTVTHVRLNCDNGKGYYFNKINWKEDGDCISANTHFQMLQLEASMHRTFNQDNSMTIRIDECYILGEEGHNLPTRQQLQDFFSCIRNSAFDELCFRSICINDKFAGELIFKGLAGHTSLTKLEIGHASLGRIGCKALGKVLNPPKSKLIDLCLDYTYLDDESLGIVCDALLGNSKMKRLSLSGNKRITSDGWQALSAVIQHPNCQLVVLELQDTSINDEELDILGSALHGLPSIKTLKLSYNDHISNTGWQTLLNQLSQTSISNLDLSQSKIDDACLTTLANMGTQLKSLDLSDNGNNISATTTTGHQSFFNSLKTRGCQLVNLNICGNKVGDVGMAVLGTLLDNKMETLDMSLLAYTDDGSSVSSQGWVSFFTASNQIDDEGVRLLVSLISGMSSLTHLTLGNNRSVTFAGWQALSSFIQSPSVILENLDLEENNINDDTVVSFASALEHNKTLNWLDLYGCCDDDENELITERGWEAVSTLVCNKTSIMGTYNSNHTLSYISYKVDDEVYCLNLNKNKDKSEVARQKILQTHLSDDSSSIQELLQMELEMMPTVIAWIGKPSHIGWKGTIVSGLSAMFNLLRKVPDLFDSSAQKRLSGTKRTRSMQTEVDESCED